MRIQHPQQRIRQFGELVIQPVMHAGGEKRHAIQQPRHMRIVHATGRQAQPPGDLRIGLGELGRQPVDRGQLAVVIGK
jgi:hypothetical protein